MMEIAGTIFTGIVVFVICFTAVVSAMRMADWAMEINSRIEELERRCTSQFAEIVELRSRLGDK